MSTTDLFTTVNCENADELEALTALYDGVLLAVQQRHEVWVNERARDIARGALVTAGYCEHGHGPDDDCVQCRLNLPPAAEAVVVAERAWADFNQRTAAAALVTIVLNEVCEADEAVELLTRILRWTLVPISSFVRIEGEVS